MKNNFSMFAAITKVDAVARTVTAIMTEEVVDKSSEIMDYDTSKMYFEQWSQGIFKASGGKSYGNMRLMHQPIIAGKAVEMLFDDDARSITVTAKVTSDEAWDMYEEGLLNGFSIGGKYVRRWADPTTKGVTRFTVNPVEFSMVDNPCVGTATFKFVGADGTEEIRKFRSAGDGNRETEMKRAPTNDEVLAKATEMATAAGDATKFMDHLDAARTELEKDAPDEEEIQADIVDAVEGEDELDADKTAAAEAARLAAAETLQQVWLAPDGTTHAKKADAVTHVMGAPAESAVDRALKAARGGDAPADAPATDLLVLDGTLETIEKGLSAAQEHLPVCQKGLYDVRSLISVIQDLRYLVSSAAWEAKSEGDGSTVPAELRTALGQLAATLITMTQEEVAELLASTDVDLPAVVEVVELAAVSEMVKGVDGLVEKVGARNSRTDASRIQNIHDTSVELGGACPCDESTKITKSVGELSEEEIDEHPVVKTLRVENGHLATEVEKAIGGITELGDVVKTLREEITAIKNTPVTLPPRATDQVLDRAGVTLPGGETIEERLKKMTPDQLADLAIRLSHMQPQAKI